MNNQRKIANILHVFQYNTVTGAVTIPTTVSLALPDASDASSRAVSSSWVRTYVSGLSYITGNQSITVSGDATGSGTTAITLTLANTAVTPGTYGSTTLVPVVTVDSKGRITSVTTAAISGSLTFTGDVTGSGTTGTSTAMTLAASGVTAGTYTKVTVDSKGRVTVGANASTTDISEGTNLYYTDTRVGTYLTANSYATQSYVGTQVANLVAAAPATLDTLNELAAALGNDPSFATTVSTSIGTKVPQTRTLTINGTAYDLSADRAWTIVSMIYPSAGIAISTGTGWGTSITDNSANWNTAYGWGNHASGGYLTSATAATTYASLTGTYANPAFISSLAYSKITGVPAFLTSYTETDPYRVTSVAVSGTSTKTITLTRADASTVTTTWTDIDTDTNTYVTSAGFSDGTLTLTRNDAGTVTVSLDGRYYLASNPSGYLTGITSSQVTTALGYTPYNSTNPSGYITGITSSNVTTALGYTPYNSTNPNGYITGITSGNVTTALGYTPYNSTNPSGYITGINSSAVTTALGFTPLSSSGNVTIGGYLTVTGAGTSSSIYMSDTDEGQREIHCNSNRIGFLTQAGAWGAYCDDSGNFFAANLSGTNTGDQTNISGNAATATNVAWSGVTSKPSYIMYYQGFTLDANTMDNNATGFTYAVNAPHTGPIVRFSEPGYPLQLNAAYTGGQGFSFRTRNGDTATWNSWYQIIHAGNIGSQTVASASNATTAGGLAVHAGRNNEANKIVRTDVNGYIQAGYINSTSGNENNNSNADRVWGTNGSDDYLRTYRTSALSVGYAASAGSVSGLTLNNSGSGINPDSVTQNQIGYNTSVSLFGQTDGGLYSSAYSSNWIHQIYGDFRTGQIAIRGKNSGTWQGWRTVIDSGNIGSQKVDGSLKFWATTHPSDYYLVNNWTGSHWYITSNHPSPVRVGYADSAGSAGSAPANGGNSSTVGGYSVDVAGSANTIPTRNASGYLIPQNWIQLNGHYGLYSGTNGAHFYPNNSTYGSWKSLGDRNGWRGIHFGEGTGMTLMMNETEFGFHREAHGWYARFTNGRFYGASDNVYNLDYALGNTHYWTAVNYFQTNNGGQAVNNSNTAKLEAYSTGNNSAFMSFHRGGYYAVNFGLDDDNVMRIGGWSASANRWQLDMSGNMTVAGDVTAYSDARVKENISTIENALSKVLALRGVSYNRIDSDDKKTKIGVIAQEILQIVPEVVNQDNDGMFNVSYGNLAGLFIEAFKEQQKEIEELKTLIYGITR